MIEAVALLLAFLLPPMLPVDAFAPGRAIAADLLPAADAVLEGRPSPS
jgi:hypothetical protein